MGWGVGWVGRSGLQAVVAVSYEGSALSWLGKRCLLLYNRQRAIPALSCYLSLPAQILVRPGMVCADDWLPVTV